MMKYFYFKVTIFELAGTGRQAGERLRQCRYCSTKNVGGMGKGNRRLTREDEDRDNEISSTLDKVQLFK